MEEHIIFAEDVMKACVLCPRRCKADRRKGQTGICGQNAEIKVARASLHMWEEPCISGEHGSGTVFFAGCALHCVFCQNHTIANGDQGKVITIERLAEIFIELQEKGANNINLVTAGHFIPQVIEALLRAKKAGLHLPVVYNTSGYEEVEALRLLEGYVDVYLPDFKYVDSNISGYYSYAPDYFEKAKAALQEMVRQTGIMEFSDEKTKLKKIGVEEYQERSEKGESYIMTKGVIVRHLLLPGCLEDSKRVLKYLIKEYGDRIFISIMNQYTPLPHVKKYTELDRKVTEQEYEVLLDYAIALGIKNGFLQEGDVAEESFIPDFDGSGV